jgi:hypothetical protein
MSKWDAPPQRKNKMVDLARVRVERGEPGDDAGLPKVKPATPTPEATSIARRLITEALECMRCDILACNN